MLVEFYVEALLVEPEAADLIWEAWAAGGLTDSVAAWAWWQIASNGRFTPESGRSTDMMLNGCL